jgi:pyrimidine operon attenuation protein / uracil phosphoribosyltransferase
VRTWLVLSPTSFNGSSCEANKEVKMDAAVRSGDLAAICVLDATDVARIIDRIAHQIIEASAKAGPDTVLLGIPTRGVPLARRLADRIAVFAGRAPDVGAVDTTLYRDDLRMRAPRALAKTIEPPGGIGGRAVILVDDVLFSGRTIRAALDAINDLGRPRIVQLAVLVDRGHRELPIRADYVGKNLPTSLDQTVRVTLAEPDGADAVYLESAEIGGLRGRGTSTAVAR